MRVDSFQSCLPTIGTCTLAAKKHMPVITCMLTCGARLLRSISSQCNTVLQLKPISCFPGQIDTARVAHVIGESGNDRTRDWFIIWM